jgi:hypothetical protein
MYCDGNGNVGPVYINTAQFPGIHTTGSVSIDQALTVVGAINSGSLTTGSFTATSFNAGTIAATGAITGPSVSVTGGVSGATVSASGAVTGASVSATGDVSGSTEHISGQANVGSLVSAGAISGSSVTATGAVNGNTLAAADSVTSNVSNFKNLVMNGLYATNHTFGTGAGTGPVMAAAAALSDACGTISFTTGTSPSASSPILTVDLLVPLGTCTAVFSPGNAAAALFQGVYIDFPISGGLKPQLRFNVGTTPLAASTSYVWTYLIIQ